MSTVRGESRNARVGASTAASTVEGESVGGDSGPATLLITPYAATVHRLHPSASVGADAISAPSWVTRTWAPEMGREVSDSARTWRKFSTVSEDRVSVRLTAAIGKSLFRETTCETLVRKNAAVEFPNVEFTTVTVLFAVEMRAPLFRMDAPETVTFTES